MRKVVKMEKLNHKVYKHTAPNGKVYIGITSKDVNERWRNGKGYFRNTLFWRAIKKYGWENIKHEILIDGISKDEACRIEQELIAKYQSNNPAYGYNLTSGGESGAVMSDATRKRMSDSMKGIPKSEKAKRNMRLNHYDCRGENNPNYGKKWTQEQLAIRQAHRVYKYGGENPSAKAILQCDFDGNIVKRWGSISEASLFYCRTSIRFCLQGKYKQHKGFIWRYEDEKER